MLYSLIARRWFGPQTQWRPLRKAFTSGLGLDALSLAWPAVVQLVIFFHSALFHHCDQFDFVSSLWCIDWGAIMRTELSVYFCIKKYIGTQVEVCRQLKIFLTPPPVRWFMLLTVLRRWSRCCSCSVWLCGLYYGALYVLVFPCSLSSCFVISFSVVVPRLGKRELVCVFLVHVFACFVRVSFCRLSLPPGVGGWLRFVIVALPGLIY